MVDAAAAVDVGADQATDAGDALVTPDAANEITANADSGDSPDADLADLPDAVSAVDADIPDSSISDTSEILSDIPDSSDSFDSGPSWLGVCPPTTLSDFAGPAPQKGFPVPGIDCAKPGWPSPPASASIPWTDITSAVGLGKLGYVDACLLWQDFNGDGKQDLFLVEQPSGPTSKRFARLYEQNEGGPWLVTSTGLPASTLIIDCAPIDVDSDGDYDVVLGTTSGLRLLRFGTFGFIDDTASLPAFAKGVMAWSMGVFDMDRDGDQDLYLTRTGIMNLQPGNYACFQADGLQVECCYGQGSPSAECLQSIASTPVATYTCCPPFELGATNLLMRNDKGTFVDAGLNSGVDDPGASLVTAVRDIDRDGWDDVFVGNDFAAPHWYRAHGDGTFSALGTSVGLRPYGHTMGIGIGDFDLDGRLDFTTADVGPITLYHGQFGGSWLPADASAGLITPSQYAVTWGQLAADLDNDGWTDVLAATSMIAKPGQLIQAVQQSLPGPYLDNGHHLLFHNQGAKFAADSVPWATTLEPTITPVSAAAADFDGDGDLDVVNLTSPGLVRVLRNDSPKAHWLEIELQNDQSSLGGVGARVQVWAQGYAQEHEILETPGSFTHGTFTRHFGLGSVASLDEVVVWWPSGCIAQLGKTAADQVVTVYEKQAICPSSGPSPPVDAGPTGDADADASDTAAPVVMGGPEYSGITPLNLQNQPLANFVEVTGQLGLGDALTSYHNDCVAGIDLDGDDRDDLVTVEHVAVGPGKTLYQIRALMNKTSGFQAIVTKIDATVWLPSTGCALADLNADGKPDLLLGTIGSGFAYYQNNGQGAFVDQTSVFFPFLEYDVWTMAAGDLSGDGDIEVYAGAGNTPSLCDGLACGWSPGEFFCKYPTQQGVGPEFQDHIFQRPNVQGKFSDANTLWQPPPGGLAPAMTFIDIDHDGDSDMLIGNDFGDHFLWLNDKGKMVRYDKQIGFLPYAHAMGWGIGDFNRDGKDDVVLADAGPVPFYIGVAPSNGLPVQFSNSSIDWGVAAATHDTVVWDPLVADFDQDGWQDIWLGTSVVAPGGGLIDSGTCKMPKNPPPQRDILLHNTGAGAFQAQVGPVPQDQDLGFAATPQSLFDFDDDGDLDIAQVRRGGQLHIYRNDSAEAKTSVRVRLKGKGGNTAMVGAWLSAKVGPVTLIRHITGNSGYGGAGTWYGHFGLGGASQIDELTIHWPGGATSTVNNIPAGSKLTVSP